MLFRSRLYICPAELEKEGLLTADEVNASKYRGEPYRTDYDFARINTERFLRTAFSRVDGEVKERIKKFRKEQSYWLEDYALFMSLAAARSTAWWRWEDGLKYRREADMKKAIDELKEDIDFYVFEQYEFYRQWFKVKELVNERGVSVIGDLPFYVATDSVDVWANPEAFQLDEKLLPKAIAGVPPDAFSRTGQVWGN